MTHVFLFGTLMWPDLLERVGGQRVPEPVACVADGYRVMQATGGAYPVMRAAAGYQAQGLLLKDCPDAVLARLDHYESPFGYVLSDIQVEVAGARVAAKAYFPPAHLDGAGDWSLERWIESDSARSLLAAEEVMAAMGVMTARQLAFSYPMMVVRADAKLNAARAPSPASPSGLGAKDVEVLAHSRPYTNFFALCEYELKVPRFDGAGGTSVHRAGFLATDAAIVLPYDPVRDRVLLVEQFRMGPFMRGDVHPWVMEPPAGRVDAGEAPEMTARREAQEEAGLTLQDVHLVHTGYPSPGTSSEYYNVYVAITDLPDDAARLGGLATEAEDIQGHLFAFDAFMDGLKNGCFPVIPLALAGYWLAVHRDELRNRP